MAISHSVFNNLQQEVVNYKEKTASTASTEAAIDPVQEAMICDDEVSLHRLGRYALKAAMKGCCKQEESFYLLDKELLPTNLKVLDKGGLFFMKKEMIGFLAKVCKLSRYYLHFPMYFGHSLVSA